MRDYIPECRIDEIIFLEGVPHHVDRVVEEYEQAAGGSNVAEQRVFSREIDPFTEEPVKEAIIVRGTPDLLDVSFGKLNPPHKEILAQFFPFDPVAEYTAAKAVCGRIIDGGNVVLYCYRRDGGASERIFKNCIALTKK